MHAIRPVQPDDVPVINALYRQEYGPHYPYPLSADRLNHGNIGLVVTHGAQLVGYAQAAPTHHERVYELGRLIIDQSHRRHGLADRLTRERLRHVTSRNALTAFAEPVCNRPDCASQRNIGDKGFVHLGIQPGKYPGLKPHILGIQPESVLVSARHLDEQSGFGTRHTYLPADYAPLVDAIIPFDARRTRTFEDMPSTAPAPVFHEPVVNSGGTGFAFVDVPINWPEALTHLADLRRQGYLFSAVLPGFGHLDDGRAFDYVRVYKPNCQVNFELIHVVPTMRPLKNFMIAEYASR